MTTDLEILTAPPAGMRPHSTRLNPKTEEKTIRTMMMEAEIRGKRTAIVRRDKTYVIIYSTGIQSLEDLSRPGVKIDIPGGLRPTIGRKWD